VLLFPIALSCYVEVNWLVLVEGLSRFGFICVEFIIDLRASSDTAVPCFSVLSDSCAELV